MHRYFHTGDPAAAATMAASGEVKEAIKNLKDSIEDLGEDLHEHHAKQSKEYTMDNNGIAGLMALMNSNKNMDLPGLIALCRDRGYDRSFSNNGDFMTVILLLFLLGNGGWGGLNAGQRAAFQDCAGNACQNIIGLHDRISSAQAVSTQGFIQLDSKICESIASVINAVRNQGDRTADAVASLATQMQNCCCQIERGLDALGCKVDGVAAEVRLAQERSMNALSAMECRLTTQAERNHAEVMAGQQAIMNKMDTMSLMDENRRLREKLAAADASALANSVADAAVGRMQSFVLAHYKPTTATTTPATA